MCTGSHPLGVSIAEVAGGYPVTGYQSQSGSLNLAQPLAALGLSVGDGNCGPENPFSTWYFQMIKSHSPWIPYQQADYVSIDLSQSGFASIAYNGFITAFDGNLGVAYQRFRVFKPLVLKNH